MVLGLPWWLSVKNLPANAGDLQEMQVQFLVQEDSLGKEVATHCSTLAWRILWTEEPGGLQSMEFGHNFMTEQQQQQKSGPIYIEAEENCSKYL